MEEELLLQWIEGGEGQEATQSERRKARNKKKKERCVGLSRRWSETRFSGCE
jgi:hypothetical protein